MLDLLSVDRANTIMKGYYASELLYIASLCFAKLSILVLFYNVVVLRTHRIFVFSFGLCIFAWSVASIVAVAFQCDMPRPWEMMTLRCFNTVSALLTVDFIIGANGYSGSSGLCIARLTCLRSSSSSCSQSTWSHISESACHGNLRSWLVSHRAY